MKIRKQVYELETKDFEKYPIWEFALGEEGDEGQDEATVCPWEGSEPLDPGDGMFVVRAQIVFADGTQNLGYLTPPVQGDASVATIQPIVLTAKGQVPFWYGVMPPSGESIRSAYEKFGRDASTVFPTRYSSAVKLVGGPITGTMNGFMHFRSFTDHTVVEVR